MNKKILLRSHGVRCSQRGAGGGEHPTGASVALLWGLPRGLGKGGCPAGRQFQEQTPDAGGEEWKGHLRLLGHQHGCASGCHL